MTTTKHAAAFLLSFLFLFTFGFVATAHAVSPPDCTQTPKPAECVTPTVPVNKAPDSGASGVIPNPFTVGGSNPSLVGLLTAIFKQILLPIGSVLAVMFFIWTGFKYVLAAGNPKKIEEANRALMYTAVGTAILLGATLISSVIQGTLQQLQ